jgi:hypothetical protein
MTDTTNWKDSQMAVPARRCVAARRRVFFRLEIAAPDCDEWEIAAFQPASRSAQFSAACRSFSITARLSKPLKSARSAAVGEKIQNLEKLAAQISSATNEWTNAQTQAEKTSAGAKEIADKMAAEVRDFPSS